MIRRSRSVTVLLALITLLAYAAEGAAAFAFCAPAAAAAAAAEDMVADAHTDHGGSVPASDDSGAAHENHCPLGMTGGGSCAVASLPAALPEVRGAPETSVDDWAPRVTSYTSGTVHPLFHPPRA